MKLKVCTKCGNGMPATTEYFYEGKGKNKGLRSTCKTCHAQYRKDNAEKIKAQIAQWRKDNAE